MNEWSCLSESPEGMGGLREPAHRRSYWAWMEIPVLSFSCGNPLMNQDFRQALRAEEWPRLRFELHSGEYRDDTRQGRVEITGKLRIAGEVREISLAAKLRGGAEEVQITGSDTLQMHDFGIDPPSGLFGLVRAYPRVIIRFDILAVPVRQYRGTGKEG